MASQWTGMIVFIATVALASTAQVEDPCKTKSRIVADDKYCDKYWECDNGQSTQYDCPNGLVFAGKHRGVTDGCDYPWRSNYCEYPKVQINPPIGTEHCDWLYGIFGHETSCTRYWTCWNGTATEQLCIGGLLYNENAHSCDWPENVDGCQKHPLCNDDPNGNVPLGKSCNRYWQCQGGYPRLQRCPAMLVFERRSLRCVVPPTEECDVPSTTTPQPEEPEERPVLKITKAELKENIRTEMNEKTTSQVCQIEFELEEENTHKSHRPGPDYADQGRPRPNNQNRN